MNEKWWCGRKRAREKGSKTFFFLDSLSRQTQVTVRLREISPFGEPKQPVKHSQI